MKLKMVQVNSSIPYIITEDTSSNIDGVIIYSHRFQLNFMHDWNVSPQPGKVCIQPSPPMDFDRLGYFAGTAFFEMWPCDKSGAWYYFRIKHFREE